MAIDLQKPLAWKQATPEEQAMLNDLQGNILKGHGRRHTLNMFFRFDPAKAHEARKFIRQISAHLTSAAKQLQEAEIFKQTRKSGDPFYAFFLSADGYRALGIAETALPGKPNDAFRSGMKARRQALEDTSSEIWDAKFQGPIHAMLLIGDEKKNVVNDARKQIEAVKPASITLLGIEAGTAMFNANGDGIEHFGYVDGRSQPLLLVEDIEREQSSKDGISIWDPSAPLKLALIPCPGGSSETAFGSFFVFRKLEQNVADFKKKEDDLARKLKLSNEDEERAGALVVGRFEDGTPVVIQRHEGMHHPVPNNFTYKDDPKGLKCPFQGHIRKTNPRGESVGSFAGSIEEERSHLLVRRGITYGKRTVDPDTKELLDRPSKDVGLLFMNYQSSIENQFEFVQKFWANNVDFVKPSPPLSPTGIDPVIGQGAPSNHQWPVGWGDEEAGKKTFGFEGSVRLKGGEYFFAPSLGFLKNL